MCKTPSTCYAYKDQENYEYFIDHSINVAQCIKERWETYALANKLSKIIGVRDTLIVDLLTFTGAFHDIGKLEVNMQEQCFRATCETFCNHFIISAFVLTNAYNMALEDKINKGYLKCIIIGNVKDTNSFKYLYSLLVIFPTALHHYARVSLSSFRRSIRHIIFHRKCINDLKNVIKWVMENIVTEELKYITENVYNTVKENRLEYIVHIHDVISELGFHKRLIFEKTVIEAATGILNLCDGRVAISARRTRRRRKP